MTHEIDENISNSTLNYCIDEYVRIKVHRDMLREKWFEGKTLEEIAEIHGLSVTRTKQIIYDYGDKILKRALEMNKTKI